MGSEIEPFIKNNLQDALIKEDVRNTNEFLFELHCIMGVVLTILFVSNIVYDIL